MKLPRRAVFASEMSQLPTHPNLSLIRRMQRTLRRNLIFQKIPLLINRLKSQRTSQKRKRNKSMRTTIKIMLTRCKGFRKPLIILSPPSNRLSSKAIKMTIMVVKIHMQITRCSRIITRTNKPLQRVEIIFTSLTIRLAQSCKRQLSSVQGSQNPTKTPRGNSMIARLSVDWIQTKTS